MNLIGLTGGIGMGKSTAAGLLEKRGLPVIDTDLVAREVVEPGSPALEEIRRLLGNDVIGADGRLRRDEVARRIFPDAPLRKQLEAIVHPRIREQWLAQAGQWRSEGRSHAVVVIPLLFETDAAALFDTVICIACSAAAQQKRLMARGWSVEQIQQRIDAQWPVEKKMSLADFVVWTEAGLDVHAQQIDRILASCQARAASSSRK